MASFSDTETEQRKSWFALKAAFLLLIFSLGFMQPDLEVSGISAQGTDLIFLVTFAIWFLAIICRKADFQVDWIYALFGLYAFGLMMSAALSPNPRFSFLKFLGEVYLIGLAVMTFNLARTKEMLKRIILVWIAASCVAAGVGTLAIIFFYLGFSNFLTDFALHHFGSLPPGNYSRIQSTFLYPSMLCNYLSVSLMMVLAARKLGWVNRPVYFALLTVFTVATAFTVTPGIGGILFAVALWFWFRLRNDGKPVISKVVLAGGTLSAICFLLVSAFTMINSPTSPYSYSFGDIRIYPAVRLLVWENAARTFLQHPFFGNGLGLGVAEVQFMAPSGQMQLLTDAHNILLNVSGQSGLLGVIPLVLICIAVIRRVSRINSGDDETAVIRLCLGISFISAFVYQGMVGSFEDARHLWVLIGLILAVDRLSESDAGLPKPTSQQLVTPSCR